MSESPRKRSPRAPSIPLDEAVRRAIAVYKKEQRHAAPSDVVARDIGYKSANSGAALSALASITGYGLFDRPEPGKISVSGDVQSYEYAPDEHLRKQLLRKWLRTPPIFAELLDRYKGGLPSDATIRYDLIQEGFKPPAAETTLKAFKQSVEYVGYYDEEEVSEDLPQSLEDQEEGDVLQAEPIRPVEKQQRYEDGIDRIPVRLDSERRAWLEIPNPFYEADKKRLKAQIDLLLTDDESPGEDQD